MKIDRLTDLTIRRLEHCFHPAGLPLVAKRPESRPSTSILIRGGPGTGKTLLAVALAHDLAKHAGGWAFYLTTDTFVVDVEAKIEMLGLNGVRSLAWTERGTARAGDVVVEHLNERLTEPVADAVEKRTRSLEIAHEYADEGVGSGLATVVVDSLGLLLGGEATGLLRETILDFIQVLEAQGISVVLVEEGAGPISEIAGFACDIILEPQVVEIRNVRSRRLAITKSRYSPAAPRLHPFASPPKPAVSPGRLGKALMQAGNQVMGGAQIPPEVATLMSTRDRYLPFHIRAKLKATLDVLRKAMSVAYPKGWVEVLPHHISVAVRHPAGPILALVTPAAGPWDMSWAVSDIEPSSRPTAFVVFDVARGEELYGEEWEPFIWSLREFGLVIGID